MNRIIVIYYSRNGSNRYLAEKTARTLECDMEEIRPRLNVFIFFLLKISLGIRSLRANIKEYDTVILCGPVWMGRFVTPLRDFVRKYGRDIRKLYFITCCGSSDKVKMEKFGHGLVFNIVKELLGDKCVHCEAFPIGLVVPEDKQEDGEFIMKTRLSDENFKGEIKERFEAFIGRVKLQ
ncbi:MAG: hypothetical protein IH594_18695 [Bacteroidales bacterium]|nr:hypothetical protein [Bacteroidales bacterium]